MMAVPICERVFPARPEQVGDVRRWVRAVLAATCAAGNGDTAALIVSELVTNTLRHSASGAPGGTFAVAIQTAATGVVLHIRDQGAPARRHADNGAGPADGDGHGHGLAIVAALSAAWGIEPAAACSSGDRTDPAAAGRCTWCRLPVPADPASRYEAVRFTGAGHG